MTALADFTREEDSGGTIRFRGDLSLAHLGDLADRLDAIDAPVARIDLSEIERIDTVGAWVVQRLAKRHDAEVTGLDVDARHLVEQVAKADHPLAQRSRRPDPITQLLGEIGGAVMETGRTLYGLLGFMGATFLAFVNVLLHPSRFRFNATVHRFEVVGVSALGIIGLMSFLIGIVIAQQGAVQLRQFGFEEMTINLVGRITLRELGILMTAIMVAGRSGSAFAAQIGTMKLTEEIDAMRTIGVSPMEALVVPRVTAVVLMLPLLGFYSSVIAIIGGGVFCWISLDIPPTSFVTQLRVVVPMTDLWVGMVKAPVFGAIIAIAGCFQGMQVEGDAEQVGHRTTTAVVQAIFLVIVLDAFFAVFFSEIGWI